MYQLVACWPSCCINDEKCCKAVRSQQLNIQFLLPTLLTALVFVSQQLPQQVLDYQKPPMLFIVIAGNRI